MTFRFQGLTGGPTTEAKFGGLDDHQSSKREKLLRGIWIDNQHCVLCILVAFSWKNCH